MATISELEAFLEARLALPVPDAAEVPLLWRPAEAQRELRRIALALEFSLALEAPAATCDALFLHRPFRLPTSALPGIPILASHLGFDAHLTTGFNPALASALGLVDLKPVFRPDRPNEAVPIGMIGTLPEATSVWNLQERITAEFGGLDTAVILPDPDPVIRIAVMNALNPALVALAADHGAAVYVTGQMRENVRSAARECGVSVIAAGHERIERWGLRRLGQEIRQAFPELETVIVGA